MRARVCVCVCFCYSRYALCVTTSSYDLLPIPCGSPVIHPVGVLDPELVLADLENWPLSTPPCTMTLQCPDDSDPQNFKSQKSEYVEELKPSQQYMYTNAAAGIRRKKGWSRRWSCRMPL